MSGSTPRVRPVRSYLYVPADNADRLVKAGTLGADAVIADLQDGVSPDNKTVARRNLAGWLSESEPGTGPQRWVRIDPLAADDDVAAAATPVLTGLVVADADSAALATVDALLTAAEQRLGLENGSVAVIPLIESAAALLDAPVVARAPRVLRLGIGEVDLAADLGLRPGADHAELAPPRFAVVAASAAAGLARPLGPTSTDFRDLERFEDSARQLQRQGFRARTAIHPAQLPAIHRVFTPTAAEVDAARDVLRRWEAADGGVALDARGRLIDAAVARIAAETVALGAP